MTGQLAIVVPSGIWCVATRPRPLRLNCRMAYMGEEGLGEIEALKGGHRMWIGNRVKGGDRVYGGSASHAGSRFIRPNGASSHGVVTEQRYKFRLGARR